MDESSAIMDESSEHLFIPEQSGSELQNSDTMATRAWKSRSSKKSNSKRESTDKRFEFLEKNSLKYLILLWNDRGRKRKFTASNESNFQRQRVNTYSNSNRRTIYQRPSFNRRADYRQRYENA